jgi:hypothetical protein
MSSPPVFLWDLFFSSFFVFCIVFIVLSVFFLCLVYPMLPVSLDCPLLIVPSVFSNTYLLTPKALNQLYSQMLIKDLQQNIAKSIFVLLFKEISNIITDEQSGLDKLMFMIWTVFVYFRLSTDIYDYRFIRNKLFQVISYDLFKNWKYFLSIFFVWKSWGGGDLWF